MNPLKTLLRRRWFRKALPEARARRQRAKAQALYDELMARYTTPGIPYTEARRLVYAMMVLQREMR